MLPSSPRYRRWFPRTIATRNLAVQFGAVGLNSFALDPPSLDAFGRRADLALWLQRNTLCLKAAVVDPSVDVELGQALIGKFGPAFAPALDHRGAVPVSRTFWPKPFSSTLRMVSAAWAWG